MNEFEWLRQMRGLNTSESPDRDLWPAIHAHIRPHPPQWRTRMLAASVAAMMLLAGGFGWRLSVEYRNTIPVAQAQTERPWRPADPRFSGAAVELYAARMELRQALTQAPHDVSLQRLLQRTVAQERRLRRMTGRAG